MPEPADPIRTTVTVRALIRIVAMACAIVGASAGPGVWIVLAYAGQQWATRSEVAKLESKLDSMAAKQAQMLCLVQYGAGRWDIADGRCRDSEPRTP